MSDRRAPSAPACRSPKGEGGSSAMNNPPRPPLPFSPACPAFSSGAAPAAGDCKTDQWGRHSCLPPFKSEISNLRFSKARCTKSSPAAPAAGKPFVIPSEALAPPTAGPLRRSRGTCFLCASSACPEARRSRTKGVLRASVVSQLFLCLSSPYSAFLCVLCGKSLFFTGHRPRVTPFASRSPRIIALFPNAIRVLEPKYGFSTAPIRIYAK